MSAISDILETFGVDPSTESELVLALRGLSVAWVAYSPEGQAVGLPFGDASYLAVGAEAEDVASLGTPRPLPSAVVWAMVAAARADGVVVEPRGRWPAWIDADVVARIGGPFGVRLDPPAVARGAAEADVLLDILGWPERGRQVQWSEDDGVRVAEVRFVDAPPDAIESVRLQLTELGEPDEIGPGASSIIDPAGWLFAAARALARQAPSPVAAHRYAARCLRQALAFAPEGGEIPEAAFFTRTGRLIRELAPERFARGLLIMRAAACERFDAPWG